MGATPFLHLCTQSQPATFPLLTIVELYDSFDEGESMQSHLIHHSEMQQEKGEKAHLSASCRCMSLYTPAAICTKNPPNTPTNPSCSALAFSNEES
mmetsp:Transcript_136929/g.237977  ORF Transcript_136929/g.237977 Transcript_136929/m.237977 type:complete len:96 (+) Transcript_136929:94-381(+)